MQDREDDFKNSGQAFEADLDQITHMDEDEDDAEEDEK